MFQLLCVWKINHSFHQLMPLEPAIHFRSLLNRNHITHDQPRARPAAQNQLSQAGANAIGSEGPACHFSSLVKKSANDNCTFS